MTDLRTCHFCNGPIPADEKAVEAKTKNGWAHFECWYDGVPFSRELATGCQLDEPLVRPRGLVQQIRVRLQRKAAR